MYIWIVLGLHRPFFTSKYSFSSGVGYAMHPILLIMWTAFQSFILRRNNNDKITLRAVISCACSLCQSRKLKSWTFRHSYYFAVVHGDLTSLFKWSLWKTALSSLFICRVFIFTFQFICYLCRFFSKVGLQLQCESMYESFWHPDTKLRRVPFQRSHQLANTW